MRKIAYKWFSFGDFDEEEAWLNEMASQGWALQTVKWFKYTFEPCEKGAYSYRLDYFGDKDQKEQADYLALLAEAGAEYITNINGWGYFRQKRELGDFILYSDRQSRLTYLASIMKTIALLLLSNLVTFLMITLRGLSSGSSFKVSVFWGLAVLQLSAMGCLIAILVKVYRKRAAVKEEAKFFE